VVFLAFAAFAWWALRRRGVTLAVVGLAFGHLIGITIVMASHDAYGQLKSSAPFVPALKPVLASGAPMFAVGIYDQTLPFYLQREVVLVDYQDEFAMGQLLEPGRSLDSLDAFATRWQALPQAAAYMDFPSFIELRQRGLPMRVIFQDQRRVVVARQ
jgi:hypothetical protein